jgi:hypothetical protein
MMTGEKGAWGRSSDRRDSFSAVFSVSPPSTAVRELLFPYPFADAERVCIPAGTFLKRICPAA